MSHKNIANPPFIFTSKSFELLKQEVMSKLQKFLPAELTYHSAIHTEYVLNAATNIAYEEKVSQSDLLKIKIAALFHDTGFMFTYNEHEEASCEYAKKLLCDYNLKDNEVNHICEIIMATKTPQSPKDICGEVLADADLEYLGTENFIKISSLLFEELKYRNPSFDLESWNQMQVNFISKHQYFTKYCKLNKEPLKASHLLRLKSLENKTID